VSASPKIVGVRTPVVVPSGTRRRTLDERFFAQFPALFRTFAGFWSRLSPHSRLRRAIVSRLTRQGCEAANRRDFELLVLAFDPEIEFRFAGRFLPPDLRGMHHGHEGYLGVWEAGIEAWNDLRIEIEEVTDYGDRVITTARQTGHGSTSGIPVQERVFQVVTLRRGLVIRQEDFTDRNKALEAAGVSE
jgi:ketosteroid isomerase-like protein